MKSSSSFQLFNAALAFACPPPLNKLATLSMSVIYKKLKEAKTSLESVINAIHHDMPVDIYAVDLTTAWNRLGEILGNHQYGDLLTELFSKFCPWKIVKFQTYI